MIGIRSRFHRSIAIAAVVVLGRLAIAAPQSPPPKLPQRASFVTVLMRDWSAWDTNRDDTLSPAEIQAAVLNPAVKGEDAAAVAALKTAIRSKKMTVPPLTKAYFQQYEAKGGDAKPSGEDAANATVDVDRVAGDAKAAPKWNLLFAAGKHRIQAAAASAAAAPMPASIDRLRQGALGDCFFVAVVGAMADRNSAAFRSVLAPLPGGGVRVTFAGSGAPFVLPPLTDAERAISSSTTAAGDLLSILEEAYGRYRHTIHPDPADAAFDAAYEGTDAICHGGSPGPVMTAFTGHATKCFNLPHDAAKRSAGQAKLLPQLRTQFLNAVHEKRLICGLIGTAPTPDATTTGDAKKAEPEDPTKEATSASLPSPPNITHGHAYAVVDYDAGSDVLTVWNPHGQTFKPKGPQGLANGYVTNHGTFKISLGEAYQFFSSFCFEQTYAPVPKPDKK